MGLFKELALLPLAPVRGTAWVAEQLWEEADRKLYDEENIKRELIQLELDRTEGRIGPEEQESMERELLDRLAFARQRTRDAELAAETVALEGDDVEILDGEVVEGEGVVEDG